MELAVPAAMSWVLIAPAAPAEMSAKNWLTTPGAGAGSGGLGFFRRSACSAQDDLVVRVGKGTNRRI